MLAFGASRGWKVATCIIVCGAIALLDESIKVLLPTREFDVVDLIKDWVGVAVAVGLIRLLGMKKKWTDNHSYQ